MSRESVLAQIRADTRKLRSSADMKASQASSPAGASGPAALGTPCAGGADGRAGAAEPLPTRKGPPPDVLFRMMAETSTSAALLLDRELNVTWANSAAATLIGQRPEALSGMSWSELVLPWTPGMELRRRLQSGEPVDLEVARRRGNNGDERFLAATLTPLNESSGGVTAIVCALRETPPYGHVPPEMEQALRQSEFRYRTVASMAPGFVFEHRLNPDGTAQPDWASDGIEAVFGCKFEEIDSHGGWFALLDEKYRPMAAARQARLAMGEPQSGETKVRTVHGETKWLHVNMLPVRDPQTGRVTGVLGSAYDITTRKLAEQALQESEAVLRAVTQNTPDWLFLVDVGLIVRFVNRQFGAHDAVDMIGRPLLEFVPEAHRASLEELYTRVFASGRAGRIELRHSDADGIPQHHEHRVVPVVEERSVRSLTVAVTDVTERKRAEAALRESQMTLQTVAASSADWLALFDRQRRCIFLNRAFRGIPPEAWIDAPVESFAPPAERRRVHEIFEHVMNTGEPRDFDQMIVDSEHGPRYLELRARAVQADGRIFGAVVNITEVTERHAQQDAMRTQARILETMQEGVVLIDAASGVVKLINPMFARMFGYDSKEELLGRSVESLFSTRALQRSRANRSVAESVPTEVVPVELECARKDGTRFVAACVLTPLTMAGANHWLAVFNDVTERKRLEREIIEISNREQQRIGNDLHDGLGQELTGIALMLKGIVTQLRKEGSVARLDVEDVIALVNNAVESTRALARGLSPVGGERGGLAAALQALATRASERYGIRVEFDTDPDEPLQLNETAATHVYRIVQEALTNVIRHSSATEVEIRLYPLGDELHLTVDDNGRGFPQPDPESPGGLGLKIMQYRTRMLGGDFMIDTSVRGGASIHCSIPLDRAVAEHEHASGA
jgi:PAS domain S-box-containing protein